MSSSRSKYVEDKLGIPLPKDYKLFLDKYGDAETEYFEIYGYTEDYIDIDKIPCVIGAQKLFRQNYPLGKHDIVLAHTGFEDVLIVLMADGGIYEVSCYDNPRKIAASFKEWIEEVADIKL